LALKIDRTFNASFQFIHKFHSDKASLIHQNNSNKIPRQDNLPTFKSEKYFAKKTALVACPQQLSNQTSNEKNTLTAVLKYI
jgi:hypothetical protein